MKTLIGMTDFVISMRENKDKDNIRRFWACERYANFLRQPLELWMFVPCGDDGNVLTDNCKQCNDNCKCLDRIKYQQANEKCLFEGFELKGETEDTWIFSVNGIFPIMISKISSIEILPQRFNINFILTATAQKQIGL